MAEKRYYWLKLKDDFFDERYIKALRKLPQGDSLVIVYLKMQLKTLKTDGVFRYESILPNCLSELALAIDESEEVTGLALEALVRFGVIERLDNDDLLLVKMQELIGSEGASAKRVREHREKKLQCNNDVTKKRYNVQECNAYPLLCHGEIEIEKEKRKDIDNIPPISPKGDEPVVKTEKDSFSESFNDFWKAYPKKVSKTSALKAWNKLKPDDNLVREILSALEQQKKSAQWQKDDGQFIPYPATWLNGRRWEDEQQAAPSMPDYSYGTEGVDYL